MRYRVLRVMSKYIMIDVYTCSTDIPDGPWDITLTGDSLRYHLYMNTSIATIEHLVERWLVLEREICAKLISDGPQTFRIKIGNFFVKEIALASPEDLNVSYAPRYLFIEMHAQNRSV